MFGDRTKKPGRIVGRDVRNIAGSKGYTLHDGSNYADSYKGYMTDWLKMLKMFQGEPLMFFEDDFEFTDDFDEVFPKAVAELPQTYDMLYLGANLQAPVTRYSEHLVRVNGAWLMHATLLSAKFIDFILEAYPHSNIRIADEWYRRIAPHRYDDADNKLSKEGL